MSAGIYKVRGGAYTKQHNIPGYISEKSCRDSAVVSVNSAFPHEKSRICVWYQFITSSEAVICAFRLSSEPSLNMVSSWKMVSCKM
jgi:hypothetical protein